MTASPPPTKEHYFGQSSVRWFNSKLCCQVFVTKSKFSWLKTSLRRMKLIERALGRAILMANVCQQSHKPNRQVPVQMSYHHNPQITQVKGWWPDRASHRPPGHRKTTQISESDYTLPPKLSQLLYVSLDWDYLSPQPATDTGVQLGAFTMHLDQVSGLQHSTKTLEEWLDVQRLLCESQSCLILVPQTF